LKIICSFGKMWLIWESKVWEGQKNKNVLKLGSRLGKPTTLVVFTNRNEAGTDEPSEKSIEIHRELQRYRMSCPKIRVPQKATKMYRIWWGHQGNAKRYFHPPGKRLCRKWWTPKTLVSLEDVSRKSSVKGSVSIGTPMIGYRGVSTLWLTQWAPDAHQREDPQSRAMNTKAMSV
jgi:hypothetical protein